jgi:NADPH:quinone reductase-like Zn-dependent oxidoreductase
VNAIENQLDEKTMQAIVQDVYGSADVLFLSQIARPKCGDDEVLVQVHAAGVDRGVWHLMTGQPYLMRVIGFGFFGPKARVRGMDVAGRVVAAGKNVTQLRIGEEVFGAAEGSFAEYARVRADRCARKPANLSFVQAAAVPVSATTALKAVRDVAAVKPGQKVLVIGAAGGVGTFAVQLAKVFGAEVTGVCSTTKLDLVRSIGADAVIDYTREDFTNGARRYDVILDIAGNRPVSRLRRALTKNGVLVLVGGEGNGRLFGGLDRQLGALVRSLFSSQKTRMFVSLTRREDLLFLTELIESGKLSPVIDRTYPLRDVPDAIRQLESGQTRGKLVITV